MELNQAQKRAVEHYQGPMMVLAGPGSGKTRVITHRVRCLIEKRGVNPSNILVVTFTKAAAVEMKQRYRQMAPHLEPVQFGTFHAIFFTILKQAYHYNVNNIIREEVRFQLLKQIVGETHLEISDENEFIHDLESEISRVKGERINLEHYYSPNCPGDIFRNIFRKYDKSLRQQRLLDFDDMLVYCYELLEQRLDIRQMWQKQYPYILIDEFQDINQVQYDVVKLLAQPENHIFVVGDDDQSVYGFRGARPDIMQSFVKDFHPKQCMLNVNYRSCQEIVQLAGTGISHNKNRLSKEIISYRTDSGLVEIKEFSTIAQQNDAIRGKLLAYHREGIPYSEMAVLFRTNTQARVIVSRLKEYNIPFVTKETVPNLYEHWISRDILAYVKVALGGRERGLVMQIINRPKRYVHRNAFTEPYVDLEELKLFYEDKNWMVERLEEFQESLNMIASMRPYAAINFIRRGVGYDDYIREYAEYRNIPADDMYEILDELQEAARGYENFDTWFDAICAYGQELEEQREKRQRMRSGKEQTEDAVEIMTMHGAKGLEYECVFIPDANEGVTPHNKAVLSSDMEEERRLFYVAMTRAKSRLHIYYLKERFNKEVSVSRFVEEILKENDKGSDVAAVASVVTMEGTGRQEDGSSSEASLISRKRTL